MGKYSIDVTYAAIDPLALLLPTDIYLIITELKHPHEPAVALIERAVAQMPAEAKRATLARARMMTEYANAVSEAIHKAGGHEAK